MSIKVLMVGLTEDFGPCGTRMYDEGIKEHIGDGVEIEKVSLFVSPEILLKEHKFDILHLNFAEGAPYTKWMPFLHLIPKKIWTFHHVRDRLYDGGPTYPVETQEWFDQFDRIIVNQPLTGAMFAPTWQSPALTEIYSGKFIYIPQPIPYTAKQNKPGSILRIASHGFPLVFKRMRAICETAVLIRDCEVHLMCARSPHVDVDMEEKIFRRLLGDVPLIMDKEFLPVEQVIENFQRAHVGVFASIPDQGGQSAAILPAVAAGTPLVISDSWHFNVIKPYAMVVDVIDFFNPGKLAQSINVAAHLPAVVPPIVEGMSWKHVAEMHKEVYESISG